MKVRIRHTDRGYFRPVTIIFEVTGAYTYLVGPFSTIEAAWNVFGTKPEKPLEKLSRVVPQLDV